MSDLKRCYEILEIKPGSSYEEAKLAFRDMVSIWHPDKFSHNARLREKAEEKLKNLNAAWEQLQAFFLQQEEAVVVQTGMELTEPVKTHMAQDKKHRQREGKATRTDNSFADLEIEPLVHFEQVRKAYRHRFHGQHPDLDRGAAQGVDSDSDNGFTAEGISPRESAGDREQDEADRQREIRRFRHDQGEQDVTHKYSNEQDSGEKISRAVRQHGKVEKELSQGKRDVLHSTDESYDERDRKVRLLSDSYWLGFLERKFVDWQQREREDKKQRDMAKEIAKKNKKLADLFLVRYKIWLTEEKSKYKTVPNISGIFKTNNSPGSTGKFLYGIPDIYLSFVKGGSFLMGNGPGNPVDKMPGRHIEQPYHVVTVDDYYIGKYPVTVRQWSKVMGVELQGVEPDFPVQLNWDEFQEFISRLNDRAGLKFRIPTEAEWEFAARSGGKDINPEYMSKLSEGSTIHDDASPAGDKVGQSKPNGLGLFEMLGNNNEWVTGSSPALSRQNGQQGNIKGSGNGGRLVIRGAVNRELPNNFTISYTFQRSFPSADKALRFAFRLAHTAF